MAGTLFVVATPLGNLEDFTFRAIRVLKEVALIAAEDTRHSRKLLAHYDIRTPVISYYDQVERQKAPKLVERLTAGQSIALIADAGTPGIADPGYRLVCAAIEANIPVVPVPGASILTATLSVAGLPTDRFAFEGFVPARSGQRRRFYTSLRDDPRTVICLEAGRRLAASLCDLAATLGERRVVVAREVTKVYEEFLRGQVSDIAARVTVEPVRGEVTVLVAPSAEGSRSIMPADLHEQIRQLRSQGLGLKEVARTLAKQHGWSVREVYEIGLKSRQPDQK